MRTVENIYRGLENGFQHRSMQFSGAYFSCRRNGSAGLSLTDGIYGFEGGPKLTQPLNKLENTDFSLSIIIFMLLGVQLWFFVFLRLYFNDKLK